MKPAPVKPGRPPLPASERAKTRAIRLSDADYAELQRRGLDALREWLRSPASGEVVRKAIIAQVERARAAPYRVTSQMLAAEFGSIEAAKLWAQGRGYVVWEDYLSEIRGTCLIVKDAVTN